METVGGHHKYKDLEEQWMPRAKEIFRVPLGSAALIYGVF
jgi:hypothetical protein